MSEKSSLSAGVPGPEKSGFQRVSSRNESIVFTGRSAITLHSYMRRNA